jgi:hypothetical protein
MEVPGKYYSEVFDFKGQWDIPSKCGLKIIKRDTKTFVIATELYQDNPGTSVTYAGYALFRQICESKGLSPKDVTYLECNPDTNSKLSFYDEAYFEVTFPQVSGGSDRAVYRQLSPDETKALFA